MTRQEAHDEVIRDLRSTGKYTDAQISAMVKNLSLLTVKELEAFMVLYRHNRETIPK